MTRARFHRTARGSGTQRRYLVGFWLQLALALGVVPVAAAASLQEVRDFGSNPSNAKMFLYVPDRLAASPPILVAIHYCGGTASAYFSGTGYRGPADQHGFIVIYPQTTSSDGCFDVHSDATLKHDGGSDSAAIVSMVRFAISTYKADASRVYVTGTSSGAMMTNVLLGAYPDVFRAGAAIAGVPYGCFAGQNAWSSACANGQITKTGQQWAELVRAAYPGYTAGRPRVQLWHGDQDETLSFHNFGEEIKQWTNVLGVSETPSTTEQNTPQADCTRTRYAEAGNVRVEAVLGAGMTHSLVVPSTEVIRFFGLDAASDPSDSAANGGTVGMAGSGNAGSSGGGGAAGRPAAAGTSAAGRSGRPSVAAAGGAGTGGASPLQRGEGGTGGVAGASESADPLADAALSAGRSSGVPTPSNDSPAHSHDEGTSCSIHRVAPGGSKLPAFALCVLGVLGMRTWRLSRARRARRESSQCPDSLVHHLAHGGPRRGVLAERALAVKHGPQRRVVHQVHAEPRVRDDEKGPELARREDPVGVVSA